MNTDQMTAAALDRCAAATQLAWYEREKENAKRLAQAFDARDSSGEIAGKISTAIMDAQDIQSAHAERVEAIASWLTAVVQELDEPELEFVRGQLLRDFCFSAHRNIEWCDDRLGKQRAEIADLLRRHKGGEVDDLRLDRAVSFGEKIQAQRDAWLDVLEAATRAYRAETGSDWTPPASADARAAAEARKQTLSRSRAERFLNHGN
jgi:hypothetical protein